MTNKEIYREVLRHLCEIKYINSAEIPNISLYMDQVTTFMNQHLSDAKRHEDDKIMTKTMVNNYVKSGLVTPPDRKMYDKEHMIDLLFIYYMKSYLPISDIQEVMKFLQDAQEHGLPLDKMYDEVLAFESDEMKVFLRDVHHKYNLSQTLFQDVENKGEQENYRLFAFLTLLGFDVYMKKRTIETIIDLIRGENSPFSTEKSEEEKKEDK